MPYLYSDGMGGEGGVHEQYKVQFGFVKQYAEQLCGIEKILTCKVEEER